MRIIIIRHADPDYSVDGLTDKGKVEAALLAKRMSKEKVSAIYCSPLGRARLTAEPTANALGLNIETLGWLREFDYAAPKLPYDENHNRAWDLLPEFVAKETNLYSPTEWKSCNSIRNTGIVEGYDYVTKSLDGLLKKHGYERDGCNYKAIMSNHDTIVLFCHFGVSGVLLSHLLNCSPYTVWQHCAIAPSAVTVIYTEERRKGIASFRAQSIGDISHLYAGNEEPSFAARFCECYEDDTRKD